MAEVSFLIADDEESLRYTLHRHLQKMGYNNIDQAENGAQAVKMYNQQPYTVVFLDLRMPVMDGIEALTQILKMDASALVIIITAHGQEENKIKCFQLGAYDVFVKPWDFHELEMIVKRGVEKKLLQEKVSQLSQQIEERYSFHNIIGNSREMREVFEIIEHISNNDATVLIFGESGTGKELVARAIHHNGLHQDKPFIAINCSAIPEGLLESELFGHEKGAFTGAIRQKAGKFELAQGGTLFLDEIGDMSLNMQAKMLRILQERKYERVGGTESLTAEVRIIAATNKDLAKAVKQGEFREDLFFRLNVIPIYLPPLRERISDISLLVEHFLKQSCQKFNKTVKGFNEEAILLLSRYHWPGNVRELENTIQRAVVMAKNNVITPYDLPVHIQQGISPGETTEVTPEAPKSVLPSVDASPSPTPAPPPLSLAKVAEEAEKKMILQVLEACHWHRTNTAKKLNISRRSLLRKMKKYGIE